MATLDGLPPLRDVIQRHGLDARKALGQNFLLDLNLTQKVARSAGSLEDATVIEVGRIPAEQYGHYSSPSCPSCGDDGEFVICRDRGGLCRPDTCFRTVSVSCCQRPSGCELAGSSGWW